MLTTHPLSICGWTELVCWHGLGERSAVRMRQQLNRFQHKPSALAKSHSSHRDVELKCKNTLAEVNNNNNISKKFCAGSCTGSCTGSCGSDDTALLVADV